MKYIKKFEESIETSKFEIFTQEEADDIKDMFQDLIDEYNLEDRLNELKPTDNPPVYIFGRYLSYMMLYYTKVHLSYLSQNLTFRDGVDMINIRIYFPTDSDDILYDDFPEKEKLMQDVSIFLKRLNSIGFTTKYSELKYKKSIDQIIISIRKDNTFKQFESISNSINSDILMDTLCQLKDDEADVEIEVTDKKLSTHLSNAINIDITVNNLWEIGVATNEYLEEIFDVIHQALNNYYNETGEEIYFILYNNHLDNWHDDCFLECYFNIISDIKKHRQKFLLMRKSDERPIEFSPYLKPSY